MGISPFQTPVEISEANVGATKYDDIKISEEFAYRDWALILAALRNSRKSLHDRADNLENEDLAPAQEIASLRGKATVYFSLIQDIEEDLRSARIKQATGQRP